MYLAYSAPIPAANCGEYSMRYIGFVTKTMHILDHYSCKTFKAF